MRSEATAGGLSEEVAPEPSQVSEAAVAAAPVDHGDEHGEHPAVTGSLKWMIALSVALGALLEVIDTSIVNVALNDMQASLGATLSEVGWVVTSYAIANVIILPLAAWLGDRFGKKRYFVFSMIAFTASSVLCGVATTLPMLIVARVLQGLFGGGLMAKAQSILFETFPKSEQGAAQALFGAVVIAGPAIGPTLGGYIVTNMDWRWIFFINLPIGIIGTIMCMVFLLKDPPLKETLSKSGKVDWMGIGLLAVGLGSLQTVLEEGQTEDWFHSNFIVTFAFGAVLGVGFFIWRQLSVKNPVVDLRVLKYPSVWTGSILGAVVGVGLYGALFAVPIFAQSILHFTAQQTGMLMLPGALMTAVGMIVSRGLSQRMDPRVLMGIGFVVLIFAVFWLGKLAPMTSEHDLFWPLMVRAIATSMIFLPLNLVTMAPVPRKDIASATGFFNLSRQLGGSFGIAFLTTFLARREVYHHSTLAEHIYATSSDVMARMHMFAGIFTSRGMDPITAQQGALAMMDGQVRLQAAVLSFGDTFYATAIILMISLPLLFILKKPDPTVKVEMGH